MRLTKISVANALLIIAAGLIIGQAQDRPGAQGNQWKLVKRATFAIDYPDNEFTSVTMFGTLLNAKVTGRLETKRKDGRTQLKLSLNNLPHPQEIGVNYTSYVVWVITRNGETDNLGRIPFSKGRPAEIELTTSHQTFGLI